MAGCPDPAMVNVPCGGGLSFCIDARETSREEYAAFLAANAAPATTRPECDGHDYAPDGACDGQSFVHEDANDPQTCVDWCDASAYCAWKGKRLCTGNGVVDPQNDQWLFACTAGGTRKFPYGNTYDPAACHGYDSAAFGAQPVTDDTCEGGFSGLFDMGGNVAEWSGVCVDSPAGQLECVIHGPSFMSQTFEMSCDAGSAQALLTTASTVGIRCCAW